MPPENTPTELEKTAYHEAGHAVVSFLLHRRFGSIKIYPQDAPSTLVSGEIDAPRRHEGLGRPDINTTPKTRERIEAEIMSSLAGDVAEVLLLGEDKINKGSYTDFSDAVGLATYITGSDEELQAYIDWLSIRTQDMLSISWHWAAVEALAKQLINNHKIGQKKAREIIKQSMSNWHNEGGMPDGQV